MEIVKQSKIQTIQDRWEQLEKNHSIFSHYEFKQAFARTYTDRLYFAVTDNIDDEINMIIPLQVDGDRIEFWWTPRTDYNEILSKYNVSINLNELEYLLFKEYGKTKLWFKDMPQKYFYNWTYVSNNIYKILTEDGYKQSMSKETIRKKIHQSLNWCIRDGINLNYEIVQWAEGIHNMLPSLFDLHHKRWDQTNTPSQFKDMRNRDLYYKLAECNGLWCQINILRGNNEIMWIHFWFYKNWVFYFYKPIYNLEYAKYSPWFLLQDFIMNDMHNSWMQIFDFLRWDEAYKKKQSNIEVQNYDLFV